MKEEKKLNRFFKIYKYLTKNKVTVDSLYNWLLQSEKKISKRQIYRDLYDLQNALLQIGVSLETEKGEKNKLFWFINESKNNNLSAQDLKAFYLLKNFAGVSINSILKTEMDALEINILKQVKSNYKIDETEFKNNVLQSGWGDCVYNEKDLKLLSNLLWAIEYKKWVYISHNTISRGLAAENNCIPITNKFVCCKLLQHRGTIHAIFLNEALNQAFIYEIEEIDLTLTNDICVFKKVNTNTLINEAINSRFGVTINSKHKAETVKLLFGKSTSPFIEKRFWHHTQKFTYNKNKELLLTLKVPINRELVGWVFMWLNHVKVIAPKKLQQIVLQKLNDIQTLYSNNKTPLDNIDPRQY